jgi:hypothetical protein
MAIATILSRTQFGMDAPQVSGGGYRQWPAVLHHRGPARGESSKDRRGPLLNCNFELPPGRITSSGARRPA